MRELEVAKKRLARAEAKIKSLEGMIEDKTRELFLTHQEVAITNEYLQNILKAMLTCLVVIDRDGNIRTVNRATLDLLGYDMGELISAPFETIWSGEEKDKPELESDSGIVTELETTFISKDGREIPVLYSSSVLHDEEGAPQGIVCIALDITSRREAEQGLREAEEKYRTIFERSVEGIFQTTLDGHYVSANPALANIHGYDSVEELTSSSIDIARDVYVDSDKREQFKLVMADQGFVTRFEAQIRRADGSIRWVSENARLVRDAAGTPLYYEGTMADVTERKEAEDALRQSKDELEAVNRALKEHQAQLLQSEKMASVGQLAAGVAHEINNPMGFISSNLGTMAEYIEELSGLIEVYGKLERLVKSGGQEDASELLSEIEQKKKEVDIEYLLSDSGSLVEQSRDGAERVRKIVQNLKEFSHVDREEKMPADLNAGIESTLNIVWNEIKYNATVEKEYGDIPMVDCFPMELNQVFMNILVNAAQAIGDGQGTITIKTRQDGDFVLVSIEDTGKGMPPEVQQRIFEPFFTTKDVGKGTGLGLNMAYNIVVKKHGGDILVDSEEGVGTTFSVKIPISNGMAEPKESR